MYDWTGKYFIINNEVREIKYLPQIKIPSQVFYEVIRLMDDIFLFLEEHLVRLNNSVKNCIQNLYVDFKYLTDSLLKLKYNNSLSFGNVKLLIYVNENNNIETIAYETPHYYPSEEQYQKGVTISLYHIEREQPNIKYINNLFQKKCKSEIIAKNVFEVLLVDHNDFITEGSKSNVFFIEDNFVLTPPSSRVLKGITRQHVFNICNALNYNIIEKNISIKELNKYTSVFITGTSPKVLPVNSVNQNVYNVQNPILQRIMKEYDLQIIDYITKIKQSGYSLQSINIIS
jgi:branched-chain amino acid aminotransferase